MAELSCCEYLKVILEVLKSAFGSMENALNI